MEGTIQRDWSQHCRERFELGALLSLVCHFEAFGGPCSELILEPSFIALPSIQLQHAQETSFGRRYNETLNRDGVSRLLGGSKYAGFTPESERIADASNS
jgi:hypothetical protein